MSFTLANVGARAGSDVVQLYVRALNPPKPRPFVELRRFSKIVLRPGERRSVSWTLDRRCFARFDAAADDWRVDAGAYELRVGARAAFAASEFASTPATAASEFAARRNARDARRSARRPRSRSSPRA